jgi:hypothetical protein
MNVSGTVPTNFNNVVVETGAANDAGTDANPFIILRNVNGMNFNNFYFTINTKLTNIGTGYVIENTTNFNQGVNFSNGSIVINGNNFAPVAGVISFDTNLGDLNFSNVCFVDTWDKIASKKFIVVTNYGGMAKVNLSQCIFDTALTYENLFSHLLWTQGDLAITRGGAYSRYIINPSSGFADGDATPSVKFVNFWYTMNTTPTTITTFHDGYTGQVIRVQILDAFTTIDFTGTNLKGNAGVDWTPANGDWMDCIFDGTNWYCAVHDCTA